jgi:hypothetical protein
VDELISGAMVRSHLEALQRRVGHQRWEEVVAALPRGEREELLLVTPLSWVRIATVESTYGQIAPPLGKTVAELHTEVATEVVGRAVTTLWRALLRLTTDEILIARSPVIFKKAYRQGRMEVARAEKGAADLRVSDWPRMSDFALRGLRVGIESTLRASGRRDPRGVAHRSADGAILRLEWTP